MDLNRLISGGPVLADGAWGTELQARGLAIGGCPDAWNLDRPAAVAEVARAYVEAGSRVILTNTFRANRIALADHGLDARTAAINHAGAAISRAAASGRALVFASIGPIGKSLAAGEISEALISAAFQEQARALAAGGVDALLIETMSDLDEATVALAAARSTGVPVIVSFSFHHGPNQDRTLTGATPEQAAARMTSAGASAVGANCGVGVARSLAICRRLRAATSLPLWIKPNAGPPEMQDGRAVYRTAPDAFAALLPELAKAGANFIGGCCGTSPEFIRSGAKALEALCGSS